MKKNYLFLLSIALLANVKVTLSQYIPNLTMPVTSSGNPYTLAWTGGFDAVSFLPIDLNGDGIKDLFTFEKTGASNTFHRYSTFINNGTPNVPDYHYEPSWSTKFPPLMSHWVIAVDFNCDGKEDLFTYNYPNGGMKAYRNDFDSTGLKFVLEFSPVQSVYFGFPNFLQVYANSQPAMADIDNDSDLDVINFQFTGQNVEYHKNMGMELFNRCDTLILEMVTECWGNFELNAFANTATLGISCRSAFSMPVDDFTQSLHAGSCAVVPDLDGDGDKDMINGDLLGDNLLYLENGGDSSYANMTSQDSVFPAYDLSVNYKTFPAPYYFDADNDGAKDLIVTSCTPNSSRNFNNVLFYKNTTNNLTNVFSWQQNDFLVGEMIDLGTGANVALADIDADGLQDMIVGNFHYVYQIGANSCRMAHFRNNGTATNPSFELITTDFASISTLGINSAAPAFGDLDADGDLDMIVGAYDGYLNYFQNDGTGNFFLSIPHMTNSAGNVINMGSYASPTIIDLNRDGKLDLVVGEKIGNLNYFENIGTSTSFSFSIITSNLGGVDVVKHGYDIYGYSTPFFFDSLGNYILYSGSLSGYVYKYNNIDGNLTGTFNLVDSMLLYEPIQSTIAGTDINADGKVDLLVGNYAGGVKWYSDFSTGISELQSLSSQISMYPNPAKDLIIINSALALKGKTEIIISDILGKQVLESEIRNQKSGIRLNISSLSNGIYVCKIINEKNMFAKKFIVSR